MAEMWRGMFDDFETELEDYVDAHDRVVTSGYRDRAEALEAVGLSQ